MMLFRVTAKPLWVFSYGQRKCWNYIFSNMIHFQWSYRELIVCSVIFSCKSIYWFIKNGTVMTPVIAKILIVPKAANWICVLEENIRLKVNCSPLKFLNKLIKTFFYNLLKDKEPNERHILHQPSFMLYQVKKIRVSMSRLPTRIGNRSWLDQRPFFFGTRPDGTSMLWWSNQASAKR